LHPVAHEPSRNMGQICSSSLVDLGTETNSIHSCLGLSRSQRAKVYPLLCDLQADFYEFAGDDGMLEESEFAGIWIRCAERKHGKLTLEEKSLIERSADRFHKVADLDGSGMVSYTEFMTFMRGGLEERGELKKMRDRLQTVVKRNPAKLAQLIKLFNAIDKNGDGFVTKQEIEEGLSSSSVASKQAAINGSRPPIPKLQRQASDILGSVDLSALVEEADVNHDGKVDLWELLAYALGRRKTPVELLLYDISQGASKRFSWALLGREFEAIYHSSVLVFGSEYWYGGRVFKTIPPCVKCFGMPLSESVVKLRPSHYHPDLMSVHLGYTLATAGEFRIFLSSNLVKKYRTDNYDVLTRNCNGFSNEAVDFLTGASIPEQVINLPQLVMATTTAKLLRPLLNRWLGGFGGGGNGGVTAATGETEDAADVPEEAPESEINHALGEGSYILAAGLSGFKANDHVVCAIVRESAGKIDVRYFDPETKEIVTRIGIDKGHIISRLEDAPNRCLTMGSRRSSRSRDGTKALAPSGQPSDSREKSWSCRPCLPSCIRLQNPSPGPQVAVVNAPPSGKWASS